MINTLNNIKEYGDVLIAKLIKKKVLNGQEWKKLHIKCNNKYLNSLLLRLVLQIVNPV